MQRRLGKYEILDEIGHGGMATVYRARDSRLDRAVAIKVMHPHLRAAPEARVRFAREARSVARLRNANILEIYDSSEEDSEEAFIVTELLTGPTLKEFAETHAHIPAEIAACFTIEIARALASAHEAGIVHRDVKPENVLLHEDRCIKLTDFGIAQMVDSQSFTVTGQILGSPGHMAPEQVEGGECDHRTDLFSLGTVLYYLACGRLPFQGRNPHQVLKRIVDGDYPDPLRVRPAIGGRLRAIIVKSLEHDLDARYQSAEALCEDLQAFVEAAGIEEPGAMLARYLPAPDEVSEELRLTLVERLTARGKEASAEGDVPGALDDFNRVLALDEGNERVLELIERLGRRSRQRTVLMVAGAALGAFGIGAIAFALFGTGLASDRDPLVRGEALVGVADAAPRGDAALVVGSPPPDGGLRGQAAGDAGAGGRPVATGGPRQRVTEVVRPGGPRLVRFSPVPQGGVFIGVDGAEPREFGPSFREMELEAGPHEFVFRGECCVEERFRVTIPPGDEPFVLRRQLSYLGRLYVAANAPNAQVSLDDGRVTGRARTIIEVPQRSREASYRITVTAPDHTAYTGTVRLEAGSMTRENITLEEAAGSEP